jgi:hypothetical protein
MTILSFHPSYSEGKGTKLGEGERDLEGERDYLGEGKGTKGIPKIIPFSGFLRSGFSPFLGFGIFSFGIISFRKSSCFHPHPILSCSFHLEWQFC